MDLLGTVRAELCVCGDNCRGIISCDVNGSSYSVHIFTVVLHDSGYYTKTKVVIGACHFFCRGSISLIPRHSSLLQSHMYDYVSRTGPLCGQCQDGSSPPVYSYYPQCVHCPEGTNNWPKYLAVSLFPTTLFFLVTVVLRLRATSPHLAGYIMFCQLMASPPILRNVANTIL